VNREITLELKIMQRGGCSVSVVISSRERHALLMDAVAALLAGDEVADEIVVVDQSERAHPSLPDLRTDRGCRIRYIHTLRRGLSRGRNEGIAASTGDILAFIDDDVLVSRAWLGKIVGALRAAGSRAVVTGRVLAGEAEQQGGFAPSATTLEQRREQRIEYRGRVGQDVLFPNSMAMWRTAFEEVGLFDERLGAGAHFPSSEDNDWGYRVLEAGYTIVYEPDVIAHHRAWRSPAAWVPLRWSYGRGQGAYFAKWMSLRDSYMTRRLWHDTVRHARRAKQELLQDRSKAAGDAVYAVAVVIGALEWLLIHRWRG
jgi:GT2 family glycosyltransferase